MNLKQIHKGWYIAAAISIFLILAYLGVFAADKGDETASASNTLPNSPQRPQQPQVGSPAAPGIGSPAVPGTTDAYIDCLVDAHRKFEDEVINSRFKIVDTHTSETWPNKSVDLEQQRRDFVFTTCQSRAPQHRPLLIKNCGAKVSIYLYEEHPDLPDYLHNKVSATICFGQ